MINQSPLAPALTAIIDYATALRDRSDSSIDDAQLAADALFDLLPADMRDDPDFADLDPAIDPSALDDLDRAALDDLRAAYIALLNSRP